MNISKNNRGETIVSVVIAITMISFALTIAFDLSRKSYTQIRMSQERSEAYLIARQTAESLNQLAKTDDSIFATGSLPEFCITFDAFDSLIKTNQPADCIRSIYTTSVSRTGSNAPFTFNIKVEWQGLSGNTQNVIINYRINQ